jgi:hypothetical protein
MIATASTDRRELARRANDGVEVALFWSKSSNQVTITILDTRTDEALEFEVDGKNALDAFSHPYAYAAIRRVRTAATPGVAVTR